MELNSFKKEYNRLLKRIRNGENYINNIATEQKVKEWMPLFLLITQELSVMMLDFKRVAGREMTDDEILNGFKDVSV